MLFHGYIYPFFGVVRIFTTVLIQCVNVENVKTKSNDFSVAAYSVAVITGGSSGIGEKFIKTLITIKREIKICNLSRREIAKNLQSERLIHYSCDLADTQSAKKVLEEVSSFVESAPAGKVLLINNSGFGSYGEFTGLDQEKEISMLSVNVAGPLAVTQAFLPELQRRGGAIINVASTASFQSTPYLATYGATKSFLRHWSLSLAYELQDKGVLVQCLCPGPTESNFFKAAGFSESPMGDGIGQTAQQVVDKSLASLKKKKILVVSGRMNWVMTSFMSKLPIVWATRLSGAVMRKLRLEQKK